MPRKEKIVTLATLHSTLKIENEVVDIDPLTLFSRLISLAEREEDATPCFEYELTNYPLSLFKGGMMRSSNKASLRNYVTAKGIPNVNLPTKIVQVIDGGALLYQIKWSLYTKFSDICKLYERHLYSKFGYYYVVFGGSGNGPSTKDMQHIKRSGKVSPNITFTSDTKCIKSQDEFLDNQNKKARFIAGLSHHLHQNGFQVY